MCKSRLIYFSCGHYWFELLEQCAAHYHSLRASGWPGWVGSLEVPVGRDMERDEMGVAYRAHFCEDCIRAVSGPEPVVGGRGR